MLQIQENILDELPSVVFTPSSIVREAMYDVFFTICIFMTMDLKDQMPNAKSQKSKVSHKTSVGLISFTAQVFYFIVWLATVDFCNVHSRSSVGSALHVPGMFEPIRGSMDRSSPWVFQAA